MAQLNPQRNQYVLSNLNQDKLLRQIRSASEFNDIVLWEMVGLNDIYTEVKAGSINAGKLGINRVETYGYNVTVGHQKRDFIGDVIVEVLNHSSSIANILENLHRRLRSPLKINLYNEIKIN